MFDLDPQIIKIGKVFAGMVLGVFAVKTILDIAGITGAIPGLLGTGFGFVIGGALMVVHIYKNEGKEEDDE